MRRVWPMVARLLVAGLIGSAPGCQSPAPPPTPTAVVAPFAVRENDGIRHEFTRDVDLNTFLEGQPSGSIDLIDITVSDEPQVFALVKVPEQPSRDLTKTGFETSFKTRDGRAIVKRWKASKGKTTGTVAGLFTLPITVDGGETRITGDAE